jgi:hypothetical protein
MLIPRFHLSVVQCITFSDHGIEDNFYMHSCVQLPVFHTSDGICITIEMLLFLGICIFKGLNMIVQSFRGAEI